MQAQQVQLDELADAIDTGGDVLDEWTYVELSSLFSPTQTPPQSREGGGWHRILHAAPQVLVFLPILITWIGLSFASRAYSSMLQSGQDMSQRSFLELWQEGFDGEIPAWLAFDRVAIYTVLTILILLAVGMWSSLDRRKQEERAEHSDETFQQQVASTMTRASRVLSIRRTESPTRFEGELTRSAAELKGLHEDARKMQSAARTAMTANVKASEAAATATTSLAETMAQVSSHIADLQSVANQLRSNESQLTAAISTVAASSAAITSSVTSSSDRIGQMISDEAQHSATQMAAAMANLDAAMNETIRRLRESLSGLASTLQSGTSSYEAAVDVAGRVVGVAGSVSKSNQEVAALVSDTASRMPDPTELAKLTRALDTVSTRLVDATSSFERTAKQLDATAQRLAAFRPSQS
jgi:myosin heavy subunit